MTDDWNAIAAYIARCRNHGQVHRDGGLRWMLQGGDAALQALERRQQATKPVQPSFWDTYEPRPVGDE